ncbi:hypothetical protein IJS77_03570 [bacterium]|nr:hypothetical protein [bacterium]
MTVDLAGHYGLTSNKWISNRFSNIPIPMNYGFNPNYGYNLGLKYNPIADTFVIRKDKSKFVWGTVIVSALAAIAGAILLKKGNSKSIEAVRNGIRKIFKKPPVDVSAAASSTARTAASTGSTSAASAAGKTARKAARTAARAAARTAETAAETATANTAENITKIPILKRIRNRLFNSAVSVSTFLRKYFPC